MAATEPATEGREDQGRTGRDRADRGRTVVRVWALVALALVALAVYGFDQLTKYLITENLRVGDQVSVLGEILQFHFVKNSGAAFSLAASSFFPALVIGVFWKRANKWGAITGMVAGLGICMYYFVTTLPFLGGSPANQWFGMLPVTAGVFGVPVGIATLVIVSLLTPKPDQKVQELVEHVRYPHLRGDIDTQAT